MRLALGILLAVAALSLSVACRPAPAFAGAPGRPYVLGEDWTHVLQVVANLRADPPDGALVVLLGDSIARESTVEDAAWTAQIAADGGTVAAAYNLSSRNRSLAENIALVKALPHTPTLVLIGVSLCSFTSPRTSATIQLPAPLVPLPSYIQHPYNEGSVLPDAEKSLLVGEWLKTRAPVFRRNAGSCARLLSRLVGLCLTRGFQPVLVEMPLNTRVIGHRFDGPVSRLRRECRAAAARWDVPFVRALARAGLVSRDFADLWHMVEPGRSICQGLLSARSATLLDRLP
jgi:hypothetical protein